MTSPPRVQVTAESWDTQRIRNTVTCGESCLIEYHGTQKTALMFVAETMTKIRCRWELNEDTHELMIYPV